MKKLIIVFVTFTLCIHSQEYYYKNNTKISLEKVHMPSTTADIEYYKTEKGILLGVTDKIIVKTTDLTLLESYATELNASIEKKLSSNLYLLKVKDRNQTFNIANALNEKESIAYAHPDFIKKRMLR